VFPLPQEQERQSRLLQSVQPPAMSMAVATRGLAPGLRPALPAPLVVRSWYWL
jgi:hypothetical protein